MSRECGGLCRGSMETKSACDWHTLVDHWHTVVITQVVSLNSCGQDILERTWLKTLIVFPEPWVKHSLEFSHFFSFLNQFINSNKKTWWHLIQSPYSNIKYKLCKSQNYLYNHYYSINKTKTFANWPKRPINTNGVDERKPQKIGDSINNDTAGPRKCSIKKVFYEKIS